jgi:tRNA threonylcarbamoyladenosine biosynthesis protein TsaE
LILNSIEWEYHSLSDHHTIRLGYQLGEVLVEGDVIALIGELGSGKTCFTKGIAYGLGLAPETVITSPSFSLANEYQGRHPFVHMDLYRLEGPEESLFLGLEEYLDEERVVVVEWAERCLDMMPEKSLTVRLIIKEEHTRLIRFSGNDPRAVEIINAIRKGGE